MAIFLKDSDLKDFCSKMPKLELHAHLHGSVRISTLEDLLTKKEIDFERELLHKKSKTLAECFQIFALIHRVVTGIAIVKRIALEVLEDFACENVPYIELRSTPRPLADGTTKEQYIDGLIETFETYEKQKSAADSKKTIPRLLLSIDRKGTIEDAMETANIAITKNKQGCKYIVGLDFSGNPMTNKFTDFQEAFQLTKEAGLKNTIHVAEVDNEEEDTAAVLEFAPERLGHAVWLSDKLIGILNENKIPIEICPTSNLHTLELSRHSQHPTLSRWLKDGYPISICTDDTAIFKSSISEEYYAVCKEFNLTTATISSIAMKTINQIFESDEIKESLRKIFDDEFEKLLPKAMVSNESEEQRKPGVASNLEMRDFISKNNNNSFLVVVDSRNPDPKFTDATLGADDKPFPIRDCGTSKRPNAINLPFDFKIKGLSGFEASKLSAIPKDAPIITHCNGGGRGQKSKDWLIGKGFTNVINGGGPQVTELWEMFGHL